MPRVILVRHGQTAFNKGAAGESAERIRGWKDVPLDTEGVRQGARMAKELGGYDVVEIYSSPLGRAIDTAMQIQETTFVKPIKNISLMPWNLGSLTGEPVKNIIDTMNWYVENEDRCMDKGECFSHFRIRYLSFLKRKLDEIKSMPKDNIIVCVTHSRNFQLTKAWEANGFPDDLSIDVNRMNDYSQETGTGNKIVLKVT